MTTAARPGSGEMFDAMANRYNLLNRIISLGVDQSWRTRAVRALELSGSARVLDVATGTGDLAIRIARALPEARVVGVDPSTRMLEIGRAKLRKLALAGRVELGAGSVEALPIRTPASTARPSPSGIAQRARPRPGLREMRRVTRSGGRVVVSELGDPESGALSAVARWHIHSVVPWVGGLLSGKAEYEYLQRSIAAFPSRAAFGAMMTEAGLELERAEPLTFGVATLFVGRVP